MDDNDRIKAVKAEQKKMDIHCKLRKHKTVGSVSLGDTCDVCSETCDEEVENEGSSHTMGLLLSGGMAGSLAKTCSAPLSRLTILFQVHSMVSSSGKGEFSSSVAQALKKILRNEGILAFWKGNGTSVIHRFPYSAVNFLAYEKIKTNLINKYVDDEEGEDIRVMASLRFCSGAMAAAIATTICYPLDLIRTRLATQLDADIKYRGIGHAFHKISMEEGLLGLYHGIGSTLCVTVPNLAINFSIYETLKEKLRAHRMEMSDKPVEIKLKVHETLLCGACAGITSSLVTFPVDVIRRRMQLYGMYTHATPTSTLDRRPRAISIARALYLEQGLRGFYRGLAPELLKVVPMVGITFGSFEYFKKNCFHID